MSMESAAARVRVDRGRGARMPQGSYPPPAVPEPAVPMLTSEQERVLLEHLPMVRFHARRIHEKLPQHVDLEDLVSAGVLGLMDAFATSISMALQYGVPLEALVEYPLRAAVHLYTGDHSPVQMNVHVHCEVRLGGWNKGNERAVHHAANR